MLNKIIRRYFEEKFFIIPIRRNSKIPLYKKWNDNPLSLIETQKFIKDGYNIAVVAKDLYILDFDKRKEPLKDWTIWYRHLGLVQFTPRGYHVFVRLKEPENKTINIKALCEIWDVEPDTIRHDDMYALLFPSRIDGKVYWWLDSMKGEILTL